MVFVAYRESMRLRIPFSSTSLAASTIHSPRTKLTKEAVQELLSLVTEGDASCHGPETSGGDSPSP
jgi:hypothetical protein